MQRFFLLLLSLLAFVLPALADAATQWQEGGVPVCAELGPQYAPLMCSDGAGGAFIAWQDYRNGDIDVYLQHITSVGERAPGWPIGGLGVCTAGGDQGVTALALDGSGGVYVAWTDYRITNDPDTYVHHVLASGMADSNWPVNGLAVTALAGDQRFPRLASDGTGGIFVVWDDQRNGSSNQDIFLQHLTVSGALATGWPANGKPVCTAPGDQGGASIVADGQGGAYIAWGDSRVSTNVTDIYALRVNASGDPVPGWAVNGSVICGAAGVQAIDGVTLDGAIGAYVVWRDFRTAPPSQPRNNSYEDIYVQRLTGAGTVVPGWPVNGFPVCTAPNTQQAVSFTADGSAGVLVAWEDYRSAPSAVYLQRVTGAGALAAGWPVNGQTVSAVAGYQLEPAIAADGLGGAYVAFRDLADTYRAYAQHLTGGAALNQGWPTDGVLLGGTVGGGNDIEITADGMGGAIVAWDDQEPPYFEPNIFAQQLAPTGPTAIAVSLVSATAEPGLVRLAWFTAEGTGFRAWVERRTAASDWQRLDSVLPDGSGRIVYEDRDVTPGTRYGYRLAYPDGSGESVSAETWVSVPALAFGLKGLTPNPSLGDPVVSFALAEATPAMLQVYDIGGRQVAEREVGSLGAGVHTLRLDESRLPAGVYTVRLTQGGRSASARAVVLR